MENHHQSVFVQDYDEGITRVKRGGYAFLMESTMLDYVVQRDCNLTQVGGLLDSKGYGVATPKGSPWRDNLSLAILELQEKGTIQVGGVKGNKIKQHAGINGNLCLQMLYNKWWKNTGDVCARQARQFSVKINSVVQFVS